MRGWERLDREVAGPHASWEDTGEGSCMGGGAPTAVSITDPQSGAQRAGQVLGAPLSSLTRACQEVGRPSQTAPGVGRGGRGHNASLQKNAPMASPVCPHPKCPFSKCLLWQWWFPGPCIVGLLVLPPCFLVGGGDF